MSAVRSRFSLDSNFNTSILITARVSRKKKKKNKEYIVGFSNSVDALYLFDANGRCIHTADEVFFHGHMKHLPE